MRKAGEFLHAAEYALQIRAPHIHQAIQIYRDQYRLARGFVLPSLLLAIVVPFSDPLPRGHVGQFPLISLQFFCLGIFFSGICLYAFIQYSVASDTTSYTISARSDIDSDGVFNTWGYVKPKRGNSTGVPGHFGTCPATGVLDPSTRAPNRLHTIGPCDLSSGASTF
jgi:hypothetical protein